MNEKLKKAYDKLSIDDKRNEISNELMVITEFLKDSQKHFGIDNDVKTAKNYVPGKDSNLTESDILTYFYEDIYAIKNELFLLNILIKQNNK